MVRDTASEPTKSGVVGLLAAALGVPRDDEERIANLASIRMGIRIDREGVLERDYHTTSDVPTTDGTGHRTVLSERYYLADALFLVVLESDNPGKLQELHDAIQQPHWPLFLGRRAFVPTRPLTTSIPSPATIEAALTTHPWLETRPQVRNAERQKIQRALLRTVAECEPSTPEAELRHDQPISYAHSKRRYTARTVRTGWVELTEQLIDGQ